MIKLHEVKSTLTIAVPLIAAFLSQKMMQFIDTMMMGWIGPSALAAGALGTSIFITTLVFGLGTLSSVGVFVARGRGAKDDDEIRKSLLHGIWLALFLSVPSVIVIWLAPYLLIRAENKEVLDNAILLLHGLSIGLPGYLLFLIFREFVSAFSLTRVVMITTIIALPLNFVLNYLLIYGKWGLPKLGVAGIGYAGAVAMWFQFFVIMTYTLNNTELKKYLKFNLFHFNFSQFRDMLFIGLPSGTLFVLESAMFLSAAIIMSFFGVEALASYQIAMQCAIFAYSIPFALGIVSGMQVSHIMGSKEYSRLKMIIVQNFLLGLMVSVTVAFLFILFPTFFIKLFLSGRSEHQATIQLAASFLFIAAFFQCFDTIQAIANGVLRGLKDTLFPMLMSVACYWLLGISTCYYFAFHTALGGKGVWYGIIVGIGSLAIILWFRLFRQIKSYI